MSQYADLEGGALMNGKVRAGLLAAVALGAFAEVSTAHRHGSWLVDLLSLAAVGVVGTAAALGSETAAAARGRQSREPEHRPQPNQPAPICRYAAGPAAAPQPRPQPFLRERPTDVRVPRFGDGAPAQGYPWQLPARTVQNGIAADEATVGALAVRAASVIGPGHRCAQPAAPRQDSYRIGRSADSRYAIVAVADGLSSAALSDAGATTASGHAVTLLREQIDRVGFHALDAKELYGRIAAAIAAHAGERGAAPADLSTVLITAVVQQPDADGVAEAWVGWLGDSSGWILDPRSPRWRFGFGDAKNRAAAVTSNEVSGRLPDTPQFARDHYVRLPPDAALALVTDGIGDPWASPAGNLNEYFANAWRSPVAATRFTADVGFDAPQCLDDRTAVVVWNGGRP